MFTVLDAVAVPMILGLLSLAPDAGFVEVRVGRAGRTWYVNRPEQFEVAVPYVAFALKGVAVFGANGPPPAMPGEANPELEAVPTAVDVHEPLANRDTVELCSEVP